MADHRDGYTAAEVADLSAGILALAETTQPPGAPDIEQDPRFEAIQLADAEAYRRIIWLLVQRMGGRVAISDLDLAGLPDDPQLVEARDDSPLGWTLTAAAAADVVAQPRTDSKAWDRIGALRSELGAAIRQVDRVRKDYRKLTDEVLGALTTHEHEMTMWGGLPLCRCGLSLGGGDAQGSMITHLLELAKPPVVTEHATRMAGGDYKVRNSEPLVEKVCPLATWIWIHQENGDKMYRRTVIVVDDWTEAEIPRSASLPEADHD